MVFTKGNNYLINYGTFNKLSTFLIKEDDKNIFLDINGKFAFSDFYIAKGTITFEEISNDEF